MINGKIPAVGVEITSVPVMEHRHCPEAITKVRFDAEKWRDLNRLMVRMGNKEYAAYLLGDTMDGVPRVTDYYIPEQEVSYTSADIIEDDLPDEVRLNIIGWIHSHHHMAAFHSGRDEDSMNYPLNVVISLTGHKATYRHATSCGNVIRSEVELVIVEEERVIPGVEKIKDKVFIYQKGFQGDNFNEFGGYNNWYEDTETPRETKCLAKVEKFEAKTRAERQKFAESSMINRKRVVLNKAGME
jgi:proteasome lid subunit RPN8/RPN11